MWIIELELVLRSLPTMLVSSFIYTVAILCVSVTTALSTAAVLCLALRSLPYEDFFFPRLGFYFICFAVIYVLLHFISMSIYMYLGGVVMISCYDVTTTLSLRALSRS